MPGFFPYLRFKSWPPLLFHKCANHCSLGLVEPLTRTRSVSVWYDDCENSTWKPCQLGGSKDQDHYENHIIRVVLSLCYCRFWAVGIRAQQCSKPYANFRPSRTCNPALHETGRQSSWRRDVQLCARRAAALRFRNRQG